MAIKLNKREKISVAAAATAVIVFLLLQFVLFPLWDENERLTRTIATRQQELTQIRLLQAEYRQTTATADQAQRQLKARRQGFTLFSFLETLAVARAAGLGVVERPKVFLSKAALLERSQ